MIDCVNIGNYHLFPGNLLASMHRLRHKAVIERQEWDVPTWEGMEYDQFDNPATTYFLWCDDHNEVRGCARLYPTDRPYMLSEVFPFLVTERTFPIHDQNIWEGSRICVDNSLPAHIRKRIIQELDLAYLEFALAHGIKEIIGVMLPAYWRSVYIACGWQPVWYGAVTTLANGDRVRAAGLPVSEAMLASVRKATGIMENILNYERQTLHTEERLIA